MKIKKIIKNIVSCLVGFCVQRNIFGGRIADKHYVDLDSIWKYNDSKIVSNTLLSKADNNNIDISFVVPLWNSHKFIDYCVGSIIKQKTNYSIEIVLVDDDSEDNTLELAKMFQKEHPDIVRVYKKSHSGISDSRNFGLAKTNGKYVCFIDHDDYLSENFVQKMLDAAIENNADIVKCSFITEDLQHNEYSRTIHDTVFIDDRNRIEMLNVHGYLWGTIYKRELFSQIRFPSGYWYEDMIVRILLHSCSKTMFYLNECLYFNVEHDSNSAKSVWSSKSPKTLEQFYLMRDCTKAVSKLNIPVDELFCRYILSECSIFTLLRTRNLPVNTRKEILVQICHIFEDYKLDKYSMSFSEVEKMWYKTIINLRYRHWQLLRFVQ